MKSSSSTKKRSKKSSKSKKHRVNYTSSESEDDKLGTNLVNTAVEVPEGATLSDLEEKEIVGDPNDPHRALDIDLEMYVISVHNTKSNISNK